MTLSRKILLKNLGILSAVAMLAVVATVGLISLRNDVSITLEEYDELRYFEQMGMHIGMATGLLSDDYPDIAAITAQLDRAIAALTRFDEAARLIEGVAPGHEEAEQALAEGVRDRLKNVRENVMDGRDKRASIQVLERILADLNNTSHDADGVLTATHRRATQKLRMTTFAVGGLSIAVFAVTIAMVIWQYHGVIQPLRRLRDGVRTIAAGHFQQKMPVDGEHEFSELAKEFNRMAGELDGLYRSLEEKVVAKSKELIRSERLASVGFLAAGVAHEINNPLSIIAGYSEMALRQLLQDSKDKTAEVDAGGAPTVRWPKLRGVAVRALQIIFEESFRCKQITEKLLSLATPGPASRRLISIADVAQEVGLMLRGIKEYEDRSIELQLSAASELTVMANENEMKQVLLNLTINALRAVKSGSGKVEICGHRSDGWIELSVRDNGSGMSPEVLERVFEPFYSEWRNEINRGIGLGMSVTHAIIEAHGGLIRAESEGPGKGSCFIVRLPAHSGSDAL